MRVDQAGIDFIKQWESFSSRPYQDQAGVWTQGFGHTHAISQYSKPVTFEEAEEWLRQDLVNAEAEVNKIELTFTQNEFNALVSLIFNTGPMPLKLTLGEYLVSDDYDAAAEQFLKWRKAGGVVSAGLERRRSAERELFLKDDE